jgi:hypothetical protein
MAVGRVLGGVVNVVNHIEVVALVSVQKGVLVVVGISRNRGPKKKTGAW